MKKYDKHLSACPECGCPHGELSEEPDEDCEEGYMVQRCTWYDHRWLEPLGVPLKIETDESGVVNPDSLKSALSQVKQLLKEK